MDPSESANYRDPRRRPDDRSDEFFDQRPISSHDNGYRHADGQRHINLTSYPTREDGYQAKGSNVWIRNDRDDYRNRNSKDFSPKYGKRSPDRYSSKERRSPYRSRRSPSPRRSSRYSAERLHSDRQYDSRARNRMYSRSRSRSRSSFSRGHYHRSRSPRKRSGHRDRSSSYDSRKRYRESSSSSASGYSARSRSRSQDRRRPKDDFLKSMYPHSEDRGAENGSVRQYRNDNGLNLSNISQMKQLSQGYVKSSPPEKGYGIPDELDDEDRFLYGDDVSFTANMKKTENPVVRKLPVEDETAKPEASPPSTAAKVTPGGFDSNALKNVLKAIGFDFEMSAQQSKHEEVVESVQVQSKAIPDEQSSQISEPRSVPTPVASIQAPIKAPPQSARYYQPYNPYAPAEYASQPPTARIHAVNAALPITIQDPSKPSGSFLVYQSLKTESTVQTPVQQMYATQESPGNLTVIQPKVDVFKEPVATARVVLPPRESPGAGIAKTERDRQARMERLNYLEKELDKLKKQQNELMRKKRREKDGHKDPLIKKNTLLQAGVEEQIREIRQAAERAARTEDADEREISRDKNIVYFDPGNHWCKHCNVVLTDLKEFLAHLHSKTHRKVVDPYDRPWMELEPKKGTKPGENSSSQSLKGSEFLIPVTGYFCALCKTFSGDPECAENHCRSHKHNTSYKNHCDNIENYEDEFKKLKSGSTSISVKPELPIPVQDEDQEETVTKKKTKKHKQKKETMKEEVKIVKQHLDIRRTEEESVKQLPRRYRDSPESASRRDSRDRKRNRWSPGYDEYESQEKYSSDEEARSRSREERFGKYENKRDHRRRTPEKRSDDRRRSRSRERDDKRIEKKMLHGNEEVLLKQPGKTSGKLPTPGFGKFSWGSTSKGESRSVFDQVPVDTEVKREDVTDDSTGKGKFAIKITGKAQIFPPRLSSSQKKAEKAFQKKKSDLLKKVEALKRENALRAQLSAITLPAGRYSRSHGKPNTAAAILGSRNLPKPGVANPEGRLESLATSNSTEQQAKPVSSNPLVGDSNEEEVIITKEIEVDVSPSYENDKKEPPPPGEGEDMIGGDDGVPSDASGISMEIASDED